MLAFQETLWQVASRRDLPEGMRFAAQRLGELLDPHAHFAASATFTVDPITIVEEFLELAQAFNLSGRTNPSTQVMTDIVKRTRYALVAETHLAVWYPTMHRDSVAALQRATDFDAALRANVGKWKWLDRHVSQVARGPLRQLAAAMQDQQVGYRTRLTAEIQTGLLTSPASPLEWRRLDDDLRQLAALLLAEGRDGPSVVRRLASRLRNAPDAVTAARAVTDLLEADVEQFVVATRVKGIRAPRGVAAFGFRLARSNSQWTGAARAQADATLRAFVEEDANSATFLTEVEAYDFVQAAAAAVGHVERLADQYRAEHRAYRISVDADCLVLKVLDDRTWRRRETNRVLPGPRARMNRRDARLEQTLRYAALGTHERAPVVRTLHYWISLETLVREPGVSTRPYGFLMANLSSLLALHGVRQSIATSWHVASRAGRRSPRRGQWRQIEAWLGVRGTQRDLADLNRWVDLLNTPVLAGTAVPTQLRSDAPAVEAAALFEKVVATLPPFSQQTIAAWQWRLATGPRLANWSAEIEQRALVAVGRMYVMRNSTVHSALTDSRGAAQLAHAAANIVDTVHEVLPRWIRPGEPLWAALVRIHRRSAHVRRTWGHQARRARINADQLTSPGGDGLQR